MDLTEKRVGGRTIHEGKIITFYEDDVILPDGNTAKREFVRHPGGVCVAPMTENGELLFVRQYRYAYARETIELPAGKIDRGEEPLHAAIRELKEETGACGELIPLGEMYPSPGYTDEIIRLFYAKNLDFGEKHPDDDEFVETVKIQFDKAVEMALDGEFKDAKTALLILKINELKNRGEL